MHQRRAAQAVQGFQTQSLPETKVVPRRWGSSRAASLSWGLLRIRSKHVKTYDTSFLKTHKQIPQYHLRKSYVGTKIENLHEGIHSEPTHQPFMVWDYPTQLVFWGSGEMSMIDPEQRQTTQWRCWIYFQSWFCSVGFSLVIWTTLVGKSGNRRSKNAHIYLQPSHHWGSPVTPPLTDPWLVVGWLPLPGAMRWLHGKADSGGKIDHVFNSSYSGRSTYGLKIDIRANRNFVNSHTNREML